MQVSEVGAKSDALTIEKVDKIILLNRHFGGVLNTSRGEQTLQKHIPDLQASYFQRISRQVGNSVCPLQSKLRETARMERDTQCGVFLAISTCMQDHFFFQLIDTR